MSNRHVDLKGKGRVSADSETDRGAWLWVVQNPSPSSKSTPRRSFPDEQHHAIAVKWQAALAREQALRRQNSELLQAQRARSSEFEHRLFNGLQLIASALLQQCRNASAPAAAQLSIAAARISAFGRVHRRLQLVDFQDKVEIKRHLQELCDDLADLLFHDQFNKTIVVQSPNCEIPDDARPPAQSYRQRADHQFGETCQIRHHRPV